MLSLLFIECLSWDLHYTTSLNLSASFWGGCCYNQPGKWAYEFAQMKSRDRFRLQPANSEPTLLATMKPSSPSSVAHGHWKHAWIRVFISPCQMLVETMYLISWFQSIHPSWQGRAWKQEHVAQAVYFMEDKKLRKEMQEESRVRYDLQGHTPSNFLQRNLPPTSHPLPIVPHVSKNMWCLSFCVFISFT